MNKPLSAALLSLAGLLATQVALAAPLPDSVNVTLTPSPDEDFPELSFALVDTRSVHAGQSFNDYYTFHLNGVSDVSFSAISDALFNAKGNVLLKLAMFDDILLSGPQDFMTHGSVSNEGSHVAVSFESLAAGDYTINLTGHGAGLTGGNYYGNLVVTGPVPEPEALAMFMGGLGIVGLLARRRRKA